MISLHLKVGDRAGYARLILPSPFVEKAFLESTERKSEIPYDAARLAPFGYIPTEIWGEVGRTTLKAQAVNDLEPGDVVILEESEAHVHKGKLEGTLSLRVGKGESGAFQGCTLESSGAIKLGEVALDHPLGKDFVS
mgnify:CR=1 FL=1